MKLTQVVSQSLVLGMPSSGRCKTMALSGTAMRLKPFMSNSTVLKSWVAKTKSSNMENPIQNNHTHGPEKGLDTKDNKMLPKSRKEAGHGADTKFFP
jgi:hypothetical protein